MKHISVAWIFDIDGVFTNPHKDKNVIHPQVVPFLVERLQKGQPIGLISGRPVVWQIETVVLPLETYVSQLGLDASLIDNLFVSGEFGGVSVIHRDGKRIEHVYQEHALGRELIASLTSVIEPFVSFIAFDKRKQTQFTVSAKTPSDFAQFVKRRSEIISTLAYVVKDEPDIEVHNDFVAINVKKKVMNKNFATDQYLKWSAKKEIVSQKFYAFGDSITDLEIGQELHKNNLPLTFVFVGEKALLANKAFPFPVIFTKELYDEGTIGFLSENTV